MPQSSVTVACRTLQDLQILVRQKLRKVSNVVSQLSTNALACFRIISTADLGGISAARQALESYIKESEIEKRARCMPDVPYTAERRTYLLVVGQAINNQYMTTLFQVVDRICKAKLLGLVVIDELQM